GPNQTLRIEPPPGYKVHTVEPLQAITNGTLQWDGPQTFGPGQPVVTFEPIPPGPLPVSLPVATSMAILAGVVIGGLVLLGWRRGWVGSVWSDVGGTETGDTAPDPETEAGNGAGAATETTRATPPPAEEPTADERGDLELLSDEERVERLLEENGGRMKQARIVEETRWSNAKVSQLLSAMAEEGRVEKLRLGRENLISLPDDDT
ncbi:MAG: helix-turn-helix transcriptional regulator, partial [Halanaeroarchaeum sp.]